MNRLCNNCTHDVLAFGVDHYSKRGNNVMRLSVEVYF